MGSLGTTQFILLLVAVATAAALCGFVASTVARVKKRRARRSFIDGLLLWIHRGRGRPSKVARHRSSRRPRTQFLGGTGRLGRSPPQPRRLPMALLTVRR